MTIAKTDREAALHEWRHVPVGATIRLKSGIWWITARGEHNPDEITMTNARTGAVVTGTPPPGQQVTVLRHGDPLYLPGPEIAVADAATAGLSEPAAAALAVALVQVTLGAHVVATRDLSDPRAPAQCPPVAGLVPHHLAAHLYLFHKIEPTDSLDLAAPPEIDVLLALHDSRRTSTAHSHIH